MTVLPQNTKKRSFIEARWTAEDTANLYGLRDWGKGYFGLSPSGHVTCMPAQDPARAIDLFEVVEGLRERGVHTPVLLRFDDLLEHRLRELRTAFDQAIADNEYSGKYTCVYPVKVNQQRHLCEQIRDLNLKFGFGLEAGSKPELLAVLALTAGHNHMPIVCNGFKDSEFIETVILATKLGRNILTVVEKYSELELIIEHSRRYNVRPQIGVRAKLSARGAGRWETSGGLRSKFGLTMADIVQASERLREVEMLDCLKMIHCHLGSQVYDIRNFKHAVTELAYIYAELRRLGAGCDTIDIGGGLGVDYDGSQSAWGQLDQLHDRRVRGGRRLPHQERLRRRQGPAREHRQRVGALHRRAQFGADLQRAGSHALRREARRQEDPCGARSARSREAAAAGVRPRRRL